MRRGCLVLIDEVAQPALLLEEGERLCRVQAPNGDTISVGRVRILYQDDRDVVGGDAGSFAQDVLRRSRELSMHDLWAVIADDDQEMAVDQACDLLTGERRGAARVAFEHRLLVDALYFERRGDSLRARKRKAVEQEILRRDRMTQLETEFEAAVAYTLERLEGTEPARSADPARNPASPSLLDDVRKLAIAGDDVAPARDVKRFLDRIGFGAGSPWSSPQRAAFELLHRLGRFREDEDLLLLRHAVAMRFPDWMVELARGLEVVPGPHRRDCTELEAYTVDDRTTRDYDDAVALEPDGDGWKLHVLIADPASSIDPGSPLWEESRRRGTTIYHPEGKIPMLPVTLSEGHLSLVAGQDRPAMDFVLHLDAAGAPWGMTVELVNARVRRNLAYDDVDEMLAGRGEWDQAVVSLFQQVHVFTRRMQADRIAHGALILRRPEVNVRVSRDGQIEIARVDNASQARELVAELMIATGAHAAAFLRDKGIPAVYRKQARSSEPGHEPPRGIIDDLVGYYAAVRQIRRAEWSLHPGAHEGLGLDQYVQVTSPLRRFQDLQLHEQIRAYLATGAPRFSQEEMLQSFAEIEDLSSRNQRIQNEARRYWVLKYLQVSAVAEVAATPVWKERQGWKVVLDEYGLEAIASLRGDVIAGQSLLLKVERVDPREGLLRLASS